MAAFGVWFDDAYDYSGQTLHYRIKMNGNAIEDGIASARDFPIRIYLNRVAQAYLKSTFPYVSGVTQDADATAEFSLVEMSGDTETRTLYEQTYSAQYSYRWPLVLGLMTYPINGHADPRQRLFFTSFNNNSTTITIE
jgi:hypothetical protein